MAVIQISKIQVRRGLQENLPQLAAGELGWSTDQRRLWIGNGVLGYPDFTPEIGNTEILTQNSDIAAAIQSYVYKGDESGYTSQTGPTSTTFITRSLQHKIDEQVSVRDFGVIGDGATDDTIAIQRAIDEVYPSGYTNLGVRRVLHFPAGSYLITSNISIPSYASLRGDGMARTLIDGATNFVTPAFTVTIGEAAVPSHIDIYGMSITSVGDTVELDSAEYVTFTDVRFQGGVTSPTWTGGLEAAVYIHSTTYGSASKISFNDCEFKNQVYGVMAQGAVKGVTVNYSNFNNLYQGVLSTTNSYLYPQAVRVVSSNFENIASYGIRSLGNSSVISAHNFYSNVGFGTNVAVVTSTATSSVLYWDSPSNFSLGDIFTRSINDQLTYGLVTQSNVAPVSTAINVRGSAVDGAGETIILAPSTSGNTSLVLSSRLSSVNINYSIETFTYRRAGRMKVSHYGGTVAYEDEYTENANTGVILNFVGNAAANTAVMSYSYSGANTVAYIKYSISSFL